MGEIDRTANVWTVPAARIKAKKEHRVPLVQAALDLLGQSREPSDLVFPSPIREGVQLSDMTLGKVPNGCRATTSGARLPLHSAIGPARRQCILEVVELWGTASGAQVAL